MKIKIKRTKTPRKLAITTQINNKLLALTANGEGYRLNPSYEAKVRVRLQFDKDIPELRFYPHPTSDFTPAISILHPNLSFVEIGAQMDFAEKKILNQHKQILSEIPNPDICFWDSQGLLPISIFTLEKNEKLKNMSYYPTDFSIVPAPIESDKNLVLDYLSDDTQYFRWKALCQTQGRRSVLLTLKNLLAEKWGFEIFQDNITENNHKAVTFHVPNSADMNPKYNHEGMLLSEFDSFIVANRNIEGCKFKLSCVNNYEEAIFGWKISCGVINESNNTDIENNIQGFLGD